MACIHEHLIASHQVGGGAERDFGALLAYLVLPQEVD